MKKIGIILPAIGLGLLLCAQTNPTPSPARSARTNNEPSYTEINSDKAEFNLKERGAVYSENVRVIFPTGNLSCDLFTIEIPAQSNDFRRATAESKQNRVFIEWRDKKGQTNHAISDKVVYTFGITNRVTNDVIVLSGSPLLINATGTNAGDLITWDRVRDTVYINNPRTVIISNGTNSDWFFPKDRSKGGKPFK